MNEARSSQPSTVQRDLGLVLVLLLLTVAAFWRLPRHGFISYDDPYYVTQNPAVNTGLTAHNLRWAFSAMHASNWHPLTWISHMLDCELFGLDARAHHLVNLALHAANALLLFALLRRLTGCPWRAWLVAAFFAVHPMHVESVAWVSERKDVLSAMFFLLTLLAYAKYVSRVRGEGPGGNGARFRTGWYLVALVCFALGLLSKPMLVTLPCVLLLLDFWPLQRFSAEFHVANLNRFSRALVEKLPFFLLTVASCVITLRAQSSGGSVAPTIDITLGQRAVNSIIAYGWYVWRLFVPVDQAIIYPLLPERPVWQWLVSGAALLAISAGVLWQVRRRPWLAFGWCWFVGVLVPVIGLVQVGMQAYADRYTYLSYIGLFVALVWTVAEAVRQRPPLLKAAATGGVAAVTACALLTQHVSQFWQNDELLYRRALAVTRNNYIALTNYGYALLERGEIEEAIRYCETSLRIAPRFAEAFNTIGCARLKQKRPDLAVTAFEQAVAARPFSPIHRNNLGTALHEAQRHEEAVQAYEGALQVDARYVDALYNLGNTLGALGRTNEAIASYEQAIALQPGFANAHLNLGHELRRAGRRAEARTAFENALRASRATVQAHYGLGQVLNEEESFAAAAPHWEAFLAAQPEHLGARLQYVVALLGQQQTARAVAEAQVAVARAPTNAPAHYWLAVALEQAGDPAGARTNYEQTLTIAPDHVEALNNFAWLLTTMPEEAARDGRRAVQLAERACELTQNQSALLLGTLAAAYAEAGRLADAARAGERAAAVADAAGETALAARNREYVQWYQAGKTWREGEAARSRNAP